MPRPAPRIEVVCVGTELLTGKVNTHTAAIGPRLNAIGLSLAQERVVGDDPILMREVFADAWRRSDAVICCGGLGPTFDDLTRDIWARVLGRPLRRDPGLVRGIEAKFRARGLRMPPMNRRQAQVLRGASVIDNAFGTAPGLALELPAKALYLLPGPPRELLPMLEKNVIPALRRRHPGLHQEHRSLRLAGVAESQVDAWVRPLVKRYARVDGLAVTHGILASQAVVTVKFSVEGRDPSRVTSAADALVGAFRRRLGAHVFGSGDDTLEQAVGAALERRGCTLSVAESCTGGLVTKLLTDRPGSSGYLLEGVVTYSNASKTHRLGVKPSTLSRHGAVSRETAREMAVGLRRSSGADFAISITGIAGPGGGERRKPVGLVFIGLSDGKRTAVRRFRFSGDRAWIRLRSAVAALDMLRRRLG